MIWSLNNATEYLAPVLWMNSKTALKIISSPIFLVLYKKMCTVHLRVDVSWYEQVPLVNMYIYLAYLLTCMLFLYSVLFRIFISGILTKQFCPLSPTVWTEKPFQHVNSQPHTHTLAFTPSHKDEPKNVDKIQINKIMYFW